MKKLLSAMCIKCGYGFAFESEEQNFVEETEDGHTVFNEDRFGNSIYVKCPKCGNVFGIQSEKVFPNKGKELENWANKIK